LAAAVEALHPLGIELRAPAGCVHGPFRGLPLIDDLDGIARVRAEMPLGDGGPAEGGYGEHGREQQGAAAPPAAVARQGGDPGLAELGADRLQHGLLGGAGVPGGGPAAHR
jgi:hypothetical protein